MSEHQVRLPLPPRKNNLPPKAALCASQAGRLSYTASKQRPRSNNPSVSRPCYNLSLVGPSCTSAATCAPLMIIMHSLLI